MQAKQGRQSECTVLNWEQRETEQVIQTKRKTKDKTKWDHNHNLEPKCLNHDTFPYHHSAMNKSLDVAHTFCSESYTLQSLGLVSVSTEISCGSGSTCYDLDASVTSPCLVLFRLCPLLSLTSIKRSFCSPLECSAL